MTVSLGLVRVSRTGIERNKCDACLAPIDKDVPRISYTFRLNSERKPFLKYSHFTWECFRMMEDLAQDKHREMLASRAAESGPTRGRPRMEISDEERDRRIKIRAKLQSWLNKIELYIARKDEEKIRKSWTVFVGTLYEYASFVPEPRFKFSQRLDLLVSWCNQDREFAANLVKMRGPRVIAEYLDESLGLNLEKDPGKLAQVWAFEDFIVSDTYFCKHCGLHRPSWDSLDHEETCGVS